MFIYTYRITDLAAPDMSDLHETANKSAKIHMRHLFDETRLTKFPGQLPDSSWLFRNILSKTWAWHGYLRTKSYRNIFGVDEDKNISYVIQRCKWTSNTEPPKFNYLVIIKEDNASLLQWNPIGLLRWYPVKTLWYGLCINGRKTSLWLVPSPDDVGYSCRNSKDEVNLGWGRGCFDHFLCIFG